MRNEKEELLYQLIEVWYAVSSGKVTEAGELARYRDIAEKAKNLLYSDKSYPE